MEEKVITILVLTIVSLALVVAAVIITVKASKAMSTKNFDLANKMLDLVKGIAVTVAVLIGGAAAGAVLTGCVAKRSITVQGTVVGVSAESHDTVRVIISSQESYAGKKK